MPYFKSCKPLLPRIEQEKGLFTCSNNLYDSFKKSIVKPMVQRISFVGHHTCYPPPPSEYHKVRSCPDLVETKLVNHASDDTKAAPTKHSVSQKSDHRQEESEAATKSERIFENPATKQTLPVIEESNAAEETRMTHVASACVTTTSAEATVVGAEASIASARAVVDPTTTPDACADAHQAIATKPDTQAATNKFRTFSSDGLKYLEAILPRKAKSCTHLAKQKAPEVVAEEPSKFEFYLLNPLRREINEKSESMRRELQKATDMFKNIKQSFNKLNGLIDGTFAKERNVVQRSKEIKVGGDVSSVPVVHKKKILEKSKDYAECYNVKNVIWDTNKEDHFLKLKQVEEGKSDAYYRCLKALRLHPNMSSYEFIKMLLEEEKKIPPECAVRSLDQTSVLCKRSIVKHGGQHKHFCTYHKPNGRSNLPMEVAQKKQQQADKTNHEDNELMNFGNSKTDGMDAKIMSLVQKVAQADGKKMEMSQSKLNGDPPNELNLDDIATEVRTELLKKKITHRVVYEVKIEDEKYEQTSEVFSKQGNSNLTGDGPAKTMEKFDEDDLVYNFAKAIQKQKQSDKAGNLDEIKTIKKETENGLQTQQLDLIKPYDKKTKILDIDITDPKTESISIGGISSRANLLTIPGPNCTEATPTNVKFTPPSVYYGTKAKCDDGLDLKSKIAKFESTNRPTSSGSPALVKQTKNDVPPPFELPVRKQSAAASALPLPEIPKFEVPRRKDVTRRNVDFVSRAPCGRANANFDPVPSPSAREAFSLPTSTAREAFSLPTPSTRGSCGRDKLNFDSFGKCPKKTCGRDISFEGSSYKPTQNQPCKPCMAKSKCNRDISKFLNTPAPSNTPDTYGTYLNPHKSGCFPKGGSQPPKRPVKQPKIKCGRESLTFTTPEFSSRQKPTEYKLNEPTFKRSDPFVLRPEPYAKLPEPLRRRPDSAYKRPDSSPRSQSCTRPREPGPKLKPREPCLPQRDLLAGTCPKPPTSCQRPDPLTPDPPPPPMFTCPVAKEQPPSACPTVEPEPTCSGSREPKFITNFRLLDPPQFNLAANIYCAFNKIHAKMQDASNEKLRSFKNIFSKKKSTTCSTPPPAAPCGDKPKCSMVERETETVRRKPDCPVCGNKPITSPMFPKIPFEFESSSKKNIPKIYRPENINATVREFEFIPTNYGKKYN